MNDSGQIAFSGRVPFTIFTGLTNTAGTNKLTLGGYVDLRPAVAGDGRVVVRSGGQANSPIVIWSTNFSAFRGIATGGGGFTRMGQSPGISANGQIVVFAGNRGNGEGIFASLQQNPGDPMGARTVVRIAGENTGAGGPSRELGTNSLGNPLYFNSFATDVRVGVTHFPQGQPGVAEVLSAAEDVCAAGDGELC